MAKNKKLVIVESPAKAKTLEKFLGKGFEVKACGGHVRDLPGKRLGVDIKNNFEPTYVTIPSKTKILKGLKIAAKQADVVFLAPDPDREGEAIAWHLASVLEVKKKIKRIEFNEITKQAVTYAVEHPREINQNRVNAQQARRILDRLMGYKLSPLLWKKIQKGLSAGRVQSVAVRLICEREKSIKAFNPKEYWSVTAKLTQENENLPFEAKLIQKNDEKLELSNKQSVDQILKDIEGAPFAIKTIKKREQKRRPPAPFITSSLQQEAARKLGFSTKKTMMLAQGLYEGIETDEHGRIGLISYMRTDSVRLSKEAEEDARNFIRTGFDKAYLPSSPRIYKSKKQAQDAHEAIRPTSVMRTPEKMQRFLNEDQLKLYALIWKRFVACQMEDAVYDQTSVDILANIYTFRSSGRIVKFEGFTNLYQESSDTPEPVEGQLPDLKEDDKLNLLEMTPKQHFTEPPPRYNEASLVKELEDKGIGRPSTYAPIISTITGRGYIEREGKALKPTDLGMLVNEQLVKHFPKILDIAFTAKMEDSLDEIVAGNIQWLDVLKEFYTPFEESLVLAEKNMAKIKQEEKLEELCPTCNKNLVVRVGRFGRFIACSGYPKCKYTRPTETEAAQTIEVCEKCGKPMILKHSRFGKFLACSGYPDCKTIKSIKKEVGVLCPKCGGNILERRSKKGRTFFGCSNYPKCNFALWNRPTGEKCPQCKALMVEKMGKNKEMVAKCSNDECGFEKEKTDA